MGERWIHKDGSHGEGPGTETDNDFGLRNECGVCKRRFKNEKGVKIHQGKSACGKLKTKLHSKIHKSEDVCAPESPHRSTDAREVWRRTRRVPSMVFTRRTGKQDLAVKETESKDQQDDKTVNLQTETIREKKQQSIRNWVETTEQKGRVGPAKCSTNAESPAKRKSLSIRESKFLREWLRAPANYQEEPHSLTKAEGKENLPQATITAEVEVKEDPVPSKRPQEDKQLNHKEVCLREEDKKKLRKLITDGGKNEILARQNLRISRKDLRSLLGRNWLSDNIIDEYLMKIQKRSIANPEYPTVAVMTVHFFKVLLREGLEEGMKSTRSWIKEDIRGKEVILIPIHHSHHWSLVYIDVKGRTIHYLDSLEGSRNTSSAPGLLKRFMEAYHREKGEEVKYKIRIRRDAPLQHNGVDCGVFICQYSERLGRRAAFNFQQRDMPSTRWKMIWEILNGELRETIKEVPSEEEGLKVKTKEVQKEATDPKEKPKKKGSVKPKRAEVENLEDTRNSKKLRINWPKGNSKEWGKLDTDLTMILSSIRGSAENRSESQPNIIYSFCLERFGAEETRGKKETLKGPSRRQKKGKSVREEINQLKETYSSAPEAEKEAIKQLQNEKIKQLRLLKRAESIKGRRQKFKRNSEEFLKQPFKFARKVLSPEAKGTLKSSKEEVEEFLKSSHSDPVRGEELHIPEDLYKYPEPTQKFNTNAPTWKEFSYLLRRTRTKSAPGPNGVPYRLYKKCPGVARLLWSYLRDLWKKNVISKTWRKAEGVFIPKEEGATDVSKFRTINLLNVEGKLQLGLLASKLTDFTLANEYIDTRIQKGGVPGISGCLEHTAILTQLIREAKKNGKDIVATWLDIANAYGSMPHKLIELALKRAHVPEELQSLIHSYYEDVSIRFTTQQFTTEFLKIEKGIITGCTLSVILFSLTMTMLMLSVRRETKGPVTESGQRQETVRLFMDDISTTTENKVQSKHLLDAISDKLEWARLQVKPAKCRSLVIRKGVVSQDSLKIQGNLIPTLKDKEVKYLGKRYNNNLDDREQVEATIDDVKTSLKKINTTVLPGKYKAWILQHMLLPRSMWPLTIYEFPATKVERVQQLFTASLKRWLGIPKSLSTDILYSSSSKLQLPYAAVSEEVKAAKARLLSTYQQSKDECIKNADINVDAGRKWNIRQEVEEAKSRLYLQEIAGIANVGREGIGMTHRQYYSTSNERERRKLIVQQVREKEEETRRFKIATLSKQAASSRWEVPERKLSHREIINTSEISLQFLIKSVYDLLPTPANKNVWYRTDEHKCNICNEEGTLNHILSGCKISLQQGRYKWRHDLVLREIARYIEEKRKQINNSPWKKRKKIQFMKAGENRKCATHQTEVDSYLNTARDWVLKVDLDGRLKVPPEIMETNLRPDMMVVSATTKQLGIVELTVPSEARIQVSSELKKMKYAPIEEAGARNGWKVRIWAVEVGCRGFPAASLATFLKEVGFIGSRKRSILKSIGQEAEKASHQIWKWSHWKEWGRSPNP